MMKKRFSVSKKRPKESSIKSESLLSNQPTWRTQLSSINIDNIEGNRRIELAFLAEYLPNYQEDVQIFKNTAYVPSTSDVKCIIYEEILYIINHYPAWTRSYVNPDIENSFCEASDEAKLFLKRRKPIPLELMAQLIKLRIIMVVYEDLYNEKLKLSKSKVLVSQNSSEFESVSDTLFEEQEIVAHEETTEGGMVIEEEVEEVSMEKFNDDYLKKCDEDYESYGTDKSMVVDVDFRSSSEILKKYMRTAEQNKLERGVRRSIDADTKVEFLEKEEEQPVKREKRKTLWSTRRSKWLANNQDVNSETEIDDIDVTEKILYVVLSGFYDPHIVNELGKIGCRVSCFINIAGYEDATKVVNGILSDSALDISLNPVPIYHNSKLTDKSKIVMNELDYSYIMRQVLYTFWRTVEELSDTVLKDIFIIRCTPTILTTVEQKYDVFQEISMLMRKLSKFKNLYAEYLKNIKPIDLGRKPKVVNASQMLRYSRKLNKLPPICFNIAALLDALLDEICYLAKVEFKPLQTNKYNTIDSMNTNYNINMHARLLNKYKFEYMPKNVVEFKEANPQIFWPAVHSHFDHPKRFVTHNTELFDPLAYAYPQLRKYMIERNTKYLKKSPPALLWIQMLSLMQEDGLKELGMNQYHAWCSVFQMSPEATSDRLQVYLLNLLKYEKKSKNNPTFSYQEYFCKPPVREAKVTVDLETVTETSHPTYGDKYDEKTFKWQEYLSDTVLLQKIANAYVTYRNMKYIYVPFMNSMLLRFHDDADDFGISTTSWRSVLKTIPTINSFFSHVVFEDVQWIQSQELNGSNYKTMHPIEVYDFNERITTEGQSIMFHSLEGFRVRVEKTLLQTRPYISIIYEAHDHSLISHMMFNQFRFHFNLSNGTMLHFIAPTKHTPATNDPAAQIFTKKIRRKEREPRFYLVEKTSVANLKPRLQFNKIHLLTESNLSNTLRGLSTTQRQSSIIKLSQNNSIILVTSLSQRALNNGDREKEKDAAKKIKTFKRTLLPHFKICSSMLHRFKYVKLVRNKFVVNFADATKTYKFLPNLNLKNRIKISRCFSIPLERPSSGLYDMRIHLPSGLQIYTENCMDMGQPRIVQYYVENGPQTKDIKNESSRTYLRNGFICIKYRDGLVKFIGVNGRSFECNTPNSRGKMKVSKRRGASRKNSRKVIKLQRQLHRKINRYQSTLIGGLTKHYIQKLLNKVSKMDPDLNDLYENGKSSGIRLVDSTGKSVIVSNNRITRANVKINHVLQDYYTFDMDADGIHTTINDSGELTTIFPDGNRITSWYTVDQEMVFIPTDDGTSTGELELDLDDYLCNFLIPRKGAWISVQMHYQFEHPNFATVIYDNPFEVIRLRLPDHTELHIGPQREYYLNIKDEMYANFNDEEINVTCRFCRKCYSSCTAKFNIKHLYTNNQNVAGDDIVFEAKDNFNKTFKVDYCGNCHRNSNFTYGLQNPNCSMHFIDNMQEFYVMDKDFVGKVYWNNQMYINRMVNTFYTKTNRVNFYLDKCKNVKVYEFLDYFQEPPAKRFLMNYCHHSPPLFKLHNNKENIFRNIAYTRKTKIEALPDCSPVLPLYKMILDCNNTATGSTPNSDVFLIGKYLPYQTLHPSNFTSNKAPIFSGNAVKKLEKTIEMMDSFQLQLLEKEIDTNNLNEITTHDNGCLCHHGSSQHVPSAMSNLLEAKILYEKILIHKLRPADKTFDISKATDSFTPPVPSNTPVSIRSEKELLKVRDSENEKLFLNDFSNKEISVREYISSKDGLQWDSHCSPTSPSSSSLLTDLIVNHLVDKSTNTSNAFDLFKVPGRMITDEYSDTQPCVSIKQKIRPANKQKQHQKPRRSTNLSPMEFVNVIESNNAVYDMVRQTLPLQGYAQLTRKLVNQQNRYLSEKKHSSRIGGMTRSLSSMFLERGERYVSPLILNPQSNNKEDTEETMKFTSTLNEPFTPLTNNVFKSMTKNSLGPSLKDTTKLVYQLNSITLDRDVNSHIKAQTIIRRESKKGSTSSPSPVHKQRPASKQAITRYLRPAEVTPFAVKTECQTPSENSRCTTIKKQVISDLGVNSKNKTVTQRSKKPHDIEKRGKCFGDASKLRVNVETKTNSKPKSLAAKVRSHK